MSKTSAKGPFLGYLYQAYCALWLILDSKEIQELSLETIDDITIEKNGDPIELIQVKHHIVPTSSLTDTSVDLWKTLGNWSELFLHGKLRTSDLTLTILTTSKVETGSAVSKLSFGKERDDVIACKILTQISENDENKTNQEYYEKFKQLGIHRQSRLIKSILILDSTPNISDIEDEILKKLQWTVNPNVLDKLFHSLIGWWFKKVIEHLRGDSFTPISRDEIHAQILDIQNQLRNDNLQIHFDESHIVDEDLPDDTMIFVKQLELISVGDRTKRNAKSDFYLAGKNRSQWGREDPLILTELKNYDYKLKKEWETYSDMKIDAVGQRATENTKKSVGKDILEWATFRTDYLCIRPLCKAPFVRRGSFHMLADQKEIGWHPDFKKLLNN